MVSVSANCAARAHSYGYTERRNEPGHHPGQMAGDQKLAAGEIRQTDAGRSEPQRHQPSVRGRQTAGTLWLAEGSGRARSPRVRARRAKSSLTFWHTELVLNATRKGRKALACS